MKGLFTHRTIQFSMSSGSFLIQNLFSFPFQGTKNLSAEHSLPIRHLSFSFRGAESSRAAGTVKIFFPIFVSAPFRCAVASALKERARIYSTRRDCQKLFNFFVSFFSLKAFTAPT